MRAPRISHSPKITQAASRLAFLAIIQGCGASTTYGSNDDASTNVDEPTSDQSFVDITDTSDSNDNGPDVQDPNACTITNIEIGSPRASILTRPGTPIIDSPTDTVPLTVFFVGNCEPQHPILRYGAGTNGQTINTFGQGRWYQTPRRSFLEPRDGDNQPGSRFETAIPLSINDPTTENDFSRDFVYTVFGPNNEQTGNTTVLSAGTDNGQVTISPNIATVNRANLASVQLTLTNNTDNRRIVCLDLNTGTPSPQLTGAINGYYSAAQPNCLYLSTTCATDSEHTVCGIRPGSGYGTCATPAICTTIVANQTTTMTLPGAVVAILQDPRSTVSTLSVCLNSVTDLGGTANFGSRPGLRFCHTYSITD
jgi:hypothetical protein